MRVGLVGTGSWAQHVHGASVVAHPDAELVAVWGRDPAKAAAVADTLGTAAVASLDALLDAVDVLTFAVPPDVQVPLALRSAKRGIRLLLEKPIALDSAAGRELVAAIDDVPSAVFLTRRWEPRTAAWLDDLAARDDWSGGRCCFVNALSADFLGGSPWRVEHGALWDVGPHALSVLERVLGRVTDVRAASGPRDLVQLLLSHESGAVSSAELSLTATPAAAQTEVVFRGDDGMTDPMPELGLEHVLAAHSAALSVLLSSEPGAGPDAAYGLHLTELLEQAAHDLRRG